MNQMNQMQSLNATKATGRWRRLVATFTTFAAVLGGALGTFTVQAAPPVNDTCAGAVVIPTASFPYFTPVLTNMLEATLTDDPLPGCVAGAERGVWYQITPTQSGIYSFSTGTDTATTAFDTIMAVFQAPSCGAPSTQIACNDDGGGANNLSGLLTPLNAGVHYYVLVWLSTGDTNTVSASIQIKVDRPSPPANDICATAETLRADLPFPQRSSVIDSVLANTEPGTVPSCASGYRSVWFKFTPIVDGTYIFSSGNETATTIFDTVMSLYSSTGGDCGTLTELVCSDAGEGRGSIFRPLTAGTTYYISISDGSSEPVLSETFVQLSVSRPTAPSITTLNPISISSTNVTLAGLVNPNALQSRFWFEWGTTTFNRTSAVRLLFPGIVPVSTNLPITGFLPNTTYQFRMVGTNVSGRTVGETRTFRWSTNGPTLNPLEILLTGTIRVNFSGNPLQTYFVDTSVNLTNWIPLGIADETEPGSGAFIYSHTGAGGLTNRYYRVRAP